MNDYWQTPSGLYSPLNKRFGFTLDPAATHSHHLTELYYCDPDDESEPQSGFLAYDGLTHSWVGQRVFLNPPYSRGKLGIWLQKAADEALDGALVLALVPHDPSTRWWQHFVSGVCNHSRKPICPFEQQPRRRAKSVDELHQRVRFINPKTGKAIGTPTFSSALVLYY